MEKRISIYVGPPLAALLDGHENRSGRLNAVAERYLAIVTQEGWKLDFSKAEWCAIFDVGNGATVGEQVTGLDNWQLAWANMLDSPEMDEKWGIDHVSLGHRMRTLGPAAKVAMHEAVIRFWQNHTLPLDEAVAIAIPQRAA